MFLQIFVKSLKSISDEGFNPISGGSLLLGIFIMEKWVEFSLTFFGTSKDNYLIKTNETLIFYF